MRQADPHSRAVVAAVAVFCLALSFSLPVAGAQFTSSALKADVYADGAVIVSQALQVPSSSSTVSIPLLSSTIAGLVVTDQNGSPLSYSMNNANLTVYTLGATEATIGYETQSLTAKNGTVWSLSFSTQFNSTISLPAGASIVYASQPPTSTAQSGGATILNLGPGQWNIKYGLPPDSTGTPPTGTSTGTPSGSLGNDPSVSSAPGIMASGASPYILGGVAVAAVAGSAFLARRRRSGGGSDLRPDDIKVLNFMDERGGKILGVEIRTKFGMPKTSAWRQIRRLEKLGYVRATKLGSDTQIELLKPVKSGTGAPSSPPTP